jgi:FkbM family methyltransferase
MPVFLQSLKRREHLDLLNATIISVGSRKSTSNDEYGYRGWGVFAPNLTVHGFDIDADACEAANAECASRQINWTENHLPVAFSSTVSEATIHITQDVSFSSLYPPNQSYTSRFLGHGLPMTEEFELAIDTTTLDTYCQDNNIATFDFLHLSVQGAELDVLNGATNLLDAGGLGIRFRTPLSPLYANQPNFGEIDTFLQKRGFIPFDIAGWRVLRNETPVGTSFPTKGQALIGEWLYLRDLLQEDLLGTAIPLKTPDNLLKLACIADIEGIADYAQEILKYLTINYGAQNSKYNCADVIVESLCQFPDIVAFGIGNLNIIKDLQTYLSEDVTALLAPKPIPGNTLQHEPEKVFLSNHYRRHTQRRLEHLASLGLNLSGTSVLEVGAGIGDLTSFYLDRGCKVLATDGRTENVEVLKRIYAGNPDLRSMLLDMDNPPESLGEAFSIIHCYGLLYHLGNPETAIEFMAKHCKDLLVMESRVIFGDDEKKIVWAEPEQYLENTITGEASHLTRRWIFNRLKQHFEFVYMPITQPNHSEFPIDWRDPTLNTDPGETLIRAIFIASRQPIDNPLLVEDIPMKQRHH